MRCLTLVQIILFTLTSYLFFKKFSKGRFDNAISLLSQYKSVHCPAGYKLYQFIGKQTVYKIQTQEPLIHGAVLSKFMRKCDVTEYSNRTFSACDFCSVLKAEDEDTLADVCHDFRYMSERCLEDGYHLRNESENTSFFSVLLSQIMEYLLTVMKRPALTPNIGNKDFSVHNLSEEDNWDVHTLLVGIFPGTLWCGFGNLANDVYTNLGRHSEVDKCCRTHDLCKPKIRPWKSRFHYNNGIVPLSHCSCDMEFYNCLKKTGGTPANRIGHIYFNLAKIPCFDFQVQEVCGFRLFGWCFYRTSDCGAVSSHSPDY